jgi:HSP20 family protein
MNGSLRISRDVLAEFDRLQQQLARVFSPQYAGSIRATAGGEFPAINIGSTPDTVEIVAFAPGIDPKSVQLTIDKGLLVLAGERKNTIPEDDERVSVYAQERFAGAFRRVVSLPEDADPAQVNANYRDGFLRVSIGKRESSKPRHIQVQA